MVLLDSRAQASQWDYGLSVKFSADDGVSVGQEVHFSSQGDGVASVVLAYENDDDQIVADIPNELLTRAQTIRVYAYVDDGDSGRTVKRWQIPVFQRPRPDDYVYTETEVRRYDTLAEYLATETGARTAADTALQTAIAGKQDRLTAGQNITIENNVISASGGGGGGGTSDYDELDNRPQVNGVTLTGNKSSADLSLASATHSHPQSQVSGLSEALAGKVSADDSRLSDARTPTAHTHEQSDIAGLASALASKGTYTKPSSGIPKTDLASAVRTSLGKADTATQIPTIEADTLVDVINEMDEDTRQTAIAGFSGFYINDNGEQVNYTEPKQLVQLYDPGVGITYALICIATGRIYYFDEQMSPRMKYTADEALEGLATLAAQIDEDIGL